MGRPSEDPARTSRGPRQPRQDPVSPARTPSGPLIKSPATNEVFEESLMCRGLSRARLQVFAGVSTGHVLCPRARTRLFLTSFSYSFC